MESGTTTDEPRDKSVCGAGSLGPGGCPVSPSPSGSEPPCVHLCLAVCPPHPHPGVPLQPHVTGLSGWLSLCHVSTLLAPSHTSVFPAQRGQQ